MDETAPPVEPFTPARDPASAGLMARFWRTKRAILQDEPLYDWTDQQLQTRGYMTPIRFNIFESLVAAIPGLFIMLILFLVLQPMLLAQSGVEVDQVLLYRNLGLLCLLLSLYLLIPPAFTGILAPFAGSGSIRVEDRTPELTRRATRAYLFMDGAHGLYTQSIIALGLVTTSWVGVNSENTVIATVSLVVGLALVIAGFYQIYLTFSRIPKLMFSANGYSTRIRRFWQKKEPDDPPWNRYQLYVIAGGFITGIGLGFIFSAFEQLIIPFMG